MYTKFVDLLDDKPGRMKVKGDVLAAVPWERSREDFHLLMRTPLAIVFYSHAVYSTVPDCTALLGTGTGVTDYSTLIGLVAITCFRLTI